MLFLCSIFILITWVLWVTSPHCEWLSATMPFFFTLCHHLAHSSPGMGPTPQTSVPLSKQIHLHIPHPRSHAGAQ